MPRIGSRISERRGALGMSRVELAHTLGVCGNSIRNWELGHCRPRKSQLPLLAQALGIEERYLRSGELPNEAPPPEIGSLVEELTQQFAKMAGVPREQIVIMLKFSQRRADTD